MEIKPFAEKNRLKTRVDECEEMIIPGKRGQIYADGPLMGVISMPGTSKKWGNARRAFEACGMKIKQNGDQEGSALFDPQNLIQVKCAMRYAGIRKRKVASQSQIEALRKARLRMATKPAGELGSSAG